MDIVIYYRGWRRNSPAASLAWLGRLARLRMEPRRIVRPKGTVPFSRPRQTWRTKIGTVPVNGSPRIDREFRGRQRVVCPKIRPRSRRPADAGSPRRQRRRLRGNWCSATNRGCCACWSRLVGNREMAEDLTQEVFLRVYRSRKQYVAGRSSPPGCLPSPTTRGERPAQPLATARGQPPRRGQRLGNQPDGQIGRGGQRPDARPATRQGGDPQVVQSAMESLSERQRLAVLLNKFEG